jgi:regulator of protease activity HflC (stomatin/prohibitin superfamily)
MNDEEVGRLIVKIAVYFAVIFIIAILLLGCITIVSAGERGVKLTLGKPSMDALGEGLHFKIPIVQSIKKLEVRTQKIETSADSASRDLQDVQTTIALNYHLLPDVTPRLYQEVGPDYKSRIIDPAIQESVKAVSARFTAEELVTRRPEVRDGIRMELTERLSKYYIQVDDFNIVNFQFSEEFDKAIEAKVTAEQNALAAKNKLEQVKYEAEQRITQANAEAEAIRIQAQAITSQGGRDYVQLQAIEKWNGILPEVTGGAVPFINIGDYSTQTQ